ncbi:hypothetical protein SDC9_78168 [bioreactor metagenome]|uniref:Uncharacterized protein n=1 Tax=bioreactor metagenome TaxID=1076179 RepID=A0A644YSQ7_9ZZZZ
MRGPGCGAVHVRPPRGRPTDCRPDFPTHRRTFYRSPGARQLTAPRQGAAAQPGTVRRTTAGGCSNRSRQPAHRGTAASEVVDDQLLHPHHVLVGVRAGHQRRHVGRDDLPADAELVLAPAALLGLRHLRQLRPVPVDLGLVGAGHRVRHGLVERELLGRTGVHRGDPGPAQLDVAVHHRTRHRRTGRLGVGDPLPGPGVGEHRQVVVEGLAGSVLRGVAEQQAGDDVGTPVALGVAEQQLPAEPVAVLDPAVARAERVLTDRHQDLAVGRQSLPQRVQLLAGPGVRAGDESGEERVRRGEGELRPGVDRGERRSGELEIEGQDLAGEVPLEVGQPLGGVADDGVDLRIGEDGDVELDGFLSSAVEPQVGDDLLHGHSSGLGRSGLLPTVRGSAVPRQGDFLWIVTWATPIRAGQLWR